jgi:glucose-6-phosphate 1-dehydrogenase
MKWEERMKDQLNKPMTLIIFGASGDLTHRKLIPALYNLYRKKRLPAEFKIIGFSRSSYSDESFRNELNESTQKFSQNTYEEEIWSRFALKVEYFQGDLLADEDFENLNSYLLGLGEMGRNRIYYLAISPSMYEKTVRQLGKHHMTGQQGCFKSIVVEKPFGRDLESAQRLNEILHNSFEEQQIYRIDHYLGKETAQNILFFRFGNTIFEPIWNRRYVSSIQITMAEKIDIAHRAEYYEKSGVLRDMFQNHMLQLLTLVAMEPPTSFEADIFRNEKVKVLHAVRPIAFEDVILGQYDGYRSEKKVSPDSTIPTYAALKLFMDN